MIQFTKVEVSSEFDTAFLLVSFYIEETEEDINDYIFDVYKSNDPHSEFHQVASGIMCFEYVDYDISLTNDNVWRAYKVVATNTVTREIIESDVAYYRGGNRDEFFGHHVIPYLQWTYDKYLEDVIGNDPYYLIRKRRNGTRCSCYDPVRRTARTPRCSICFGVGIVGGYYDPVELNISFYSAPTSTQTVDPSKIINMDSPIQAWSKSYPRVQVDDIIIGSSSNGKRYKVMAVQKSLRKEYTLRQIFQIQSIPESDIAYMYPFDLENVRDVKEEGRDYYVRSKFDSGES